jgi:hypothetical protein
MEARNPKALASLDRKRTPMFFPGFGIIFKRRNKGNLIP